MHPRHVSVDGDEGEFQRWYYWTDVNSEGIRMGSDYLFWENDTIFGTGDISIDFGYEIINFLSYTSPTKQRSLPTTSPTTNKQTTIHPTPLTTAYPSTNPLSIDIIDYIICDQDFNK